MHYFYLICTGEKLTKDEAKGLMKELCEPEDDEGFMPFMRKYFKSHLSLHFFPFLAFFSRKKWDESKYLLLFRAIKRQWCAAFLFIGGLKISSEYARQKSKK